MGFLQNFRYAGSSMIRAPGFAAVVIVILAVGIGANVAMFSILDTAMLRSLPYADPDRLVLGRNDVRRQHQLDVVGARLLGLARFERVIRISFRDFGLHS